MIHSNNIKYAAIATTIIQSVGLICVLLATYITKSAWCLWAILLVMSMGVEYKSNYNDKKGSKDE